MQSNFADAGIVAPSGAVKSQFVGSQAGRTDIERPPAIARLPDAPTRPFWSVMIPIYNCREDYLRETLQSVLCQDPGAGEMQIEVIDNCSTVGDPEAIVRELGGGRIDFHRQSKNIGAGENFNTCIRRARGQWVHILHGDDTIRPGFYAHLREGVVAHPEAAAAFCRLIYTNEHAQWTAFSEWEASKPGMLDDDFAMRQFMEQRIQFVSIVVHRSTYEELGGFRASMDHSMDWDMWKRVAATKPIYFHPDPMACYRLHPAADSSRIIRTGENVRRERQSIEWTCADLPPEHASRMRRAAMKAAGIRAVRRARQLWINGQREVAWRQLMEGMRCSLAPAVLARVAYFLLRAAAG